MVRIIRQADAHSRNETRSLLQSIFTAELVQPSQEFWLTSPWISDIPIIDNRAMSCDIGEQWGPSEIPLSKVLVAMARHGSWIKIITTKDPKNNEFLGRLDSEKNQRRVQNQISIHFDDDERLHEKAVVGDDFVIDGSMNFTFFGLLIRRERVNFDADSQRVAQVRLEMRGDYGGRND